MSLTDLERLLWERLDGTLAAEDLSRLERLLETEPGAGQLEEEISGLALRLDGLEEAPAPAGLADEIRRSIRAAESPSAAAEPEARRGGLGRLFRPPTIRRLAYLAAGFGIALLSYQLMVDGTGVVDTGAFSGTAGLTEPDSAAPAVPVGRRGVLAVSRRDTAIVIAVELSDELDGAVLEIRGAGLEALRVESFESRGGGAIEQLEPLEPRIVGDGLEIDLVAGAGVEVAITAPADGQTLALTLRSGSQILVTRQLLPAELTETEKRTNF